MIEQIHYAKGARDVAPHTHPCYQIIYLKKGRLKVHIGEKQYDALAPALIFVSKLEQHAFQVVGNVYERYYMSISPAAAGSFIRDYTLLTPLSNRPADFCHVLDISAFWQEADRIFETSAAESPEAPYGKERQTALLYELLILVYREKPALFSRENNKSISAVWKIQRRFEQRYQEPCTLGDLAAEYHMSPCYLAHLFKRVTGISVMQYLTQCRLSAARQLLSETDLSVTEIVNAAGFSDSSNFARLFKRETGCSPTVFRKEHR